MAKLILAGKHAWMLFFLFKLKHKYISDLLRLFDYVYVWFIWHGMFARIILEITSKMVDYSSRDSPYRSYEQPRKGYSPNIEDTLRSLKKEMLSYKVDKDIIIQSQERLAKVEEKQVEVNAIIL